MRLLDLFSGIGGFSLAAQWVWGDELEIVGFCEQDKYCQKVLRKNFGEDIPIYDKIEDLTYEQIIANTVNIRCSSSKFRKSKESENKYGIGRSSENTAHRENKDESMERTAEAPIPPIDLITGGFPCQPFSVAGKRQGKEDDRYLWHEMLRIIAETSPKWVIGENVANIVNMALDDVLFDLEGLDYTTESFVIPACAVGARHRRDRVWIVAYNERLEWTQRIEQSAVQSQKQKPKGQATGKLCEMASSQNVAYPECVRWNAGEYRLSPKSNSTEREYNEASKQNGKRQRFGISETGQNVADTNERKTGKANWQGTTQWAVEPDVGRVANGVPNRVDRLKGLGNAIVPQVVVPIMQTIKQIEA